MERKTKWMWVEGRERERVGQGGKCAGEARDGLLDKGVLRRKGMTVKGKGEGRCGTASWWRERDKISGEERDGWGYGKKRWRKDDRGTGKMHTWIRRKIVKRKSKKRRKSMER